MIVAEAQSCELCQHFCPSRGSKTLGVCHADWIRDAHPKGLPVRRYQGTECAFFEPAAGSVHWGRHAG